MIAVPPEEFSRKQAACSSLTKIFFEEQFSVNGFHDGISP
jgi:hypothetical protein